MKKIFLFITLLMLGNLAFGQTAIFVRGNVYNDPNGGIVNASGTSQYLPSGGLKALLVKRNNGMDTVKFVGTVNATTRNFNMIVMRSSANYGDYYVMIVETSVVATINQPPPANATLPSGWAFTGESIDSVTNTPDATVDGKTVFFPIIATSNAITNRNFGIQETPLSHNKMNDPINASASNPVPLTVSMFDAFTQGTASILSGKDTNGGVITHYAIQSLPTYGTLFIDGTPVSYASQASQLTAAQVATLAYLPSATANSHTQDEFTYYTIDNAPSNSPVSRYIIPIDATLPVTLTEFKATEHDNTVLLQWVTASEKNNHLFEIEKSNDGRNWRTLDKVSSKATNGFSSEIITYQYTDKKPEVGHNYYRLKQVDFNNQFEYSTIQTISIAPSNVITIYPNPTTNTIHISGLNGAERITIADATGRLLMSMHTNGASTELSLEKLQPGNYFVTISSKEGTTLFQQMVIKL